MHMAPTYNMIGLKPLDEFVFDMLWRVWVSIRGEGVADVRDMELGRIERREPAYSSPLVVVQNRDFPSVHICVM